MGDDEVRFIDDDKGTRFGYQPDDKPEKIQEGYQPTKSLDPNNPPPGKGTGVQDSGETERDSE